MVCTPSVSMMDVSYVNSQSVSIGHRASVYDSRCHYKMETGIEVRDCGSESTGNPISVRSTAVLWGKIRTSNAA